MQRSSQISICNYSLENSSSAVRVYGQHQYITVSKLRHKFSYGFRSKQGGFDFDCGALLVG